MNRAAHLLSALIIILMLAGGATLAWFTSRSSVAETAIRMGSMNVDISVNSGFGEYVNGAFQPSNKEGFPKGFFDHLGKIKKSAVFRMDYSIKNEARFDVIARVNQAGVDVEQSSACKADFKSVAIRVYSLRSKYLREAGNPQGGNSSYTNDELLESNGFKPFDLDQFEFYGLGEAEFSQFSDGQTGTSPFGLNVKASFTGSVGAKAASGTGAIGENGTSSAPNCIYLYLPQNSTATFAYEFTAADSDETDSNAPLFASNEYQYAVLALDATNMSLSDRVLRVYAIEAAEASFEDTFRNLEDEKRVASVFGLAGWKVNGALVTPKPLPTCAP